jgi:ribosome-interacting GTPase 1
MEFVYEIKASNSGDGIVKVQNHYFTRLEAKEVYMKAKNSKDAIDDTLIILIGNNDMSDIHSAITFGVEEGEQFALALLNLCYAIKY